jgi:predicted neuraminidase
MALAAAGAVAVLATAAAGGGSGPRTSGLIMSGLIFPPGPELPSSHASTVAPMPDGDVLCAWYSGRAEAARDVAVYASRLHQGQWSPPAVIADTPNKPEGNPVLFADPSGKTWLFFVTIEGLGWNWARLKYQTSPDSGRTWGPPAVLVKKLGTMPRNHPLALRDGRIILPLYSENQWCSEFMTSSDLGASWERAAQVCSKPGNIQAAAVELDDGSLLAMMRTGARKGAGKIWQTRSTDGRTWDPPSLTALPNPNAGIDLIRLRSGKLLLAFNNTDYARTPLSLAVSSDAGRTWDVVRDVETGPGEYSYPSLCQAADGAIHLTYTYRRESIKHLAFTEEYITR